MGSDKGSGNSKTTGDLGQCLNEKLNILKGFLSITESLRMNVDSQNLEEMAQLLGRREAMILEVDRIDERIEEVQSKKGGIKTGLPLDDRESLRLILSSIELVLQRALMLDRECIQKVALLRDAIKNEWMGVKKSIKAVHSYAGTPAQTPRFLDVRK
jgi:hypothetical protein